jgi:hypothetical protein
MVSTRKALTIEERSLPLENTIDPGFVHKRKIQTILGNKWMRHVDEGIHSLPQLPEWQKVIRIDHIYKDNILKFCEIVGIKTLEEALATEPGVGMLICSTETLGPCKNVYDSERAVNVWVPRGKYPKNVEFHYSTQHVYASTLREHLYKGSEISIVAELREIEDDLLVFHPILMGFPWLRAEVRDWEFKAQTWRYRFFENFIEDFDEFSKVRDIHRPKDIKPMRNISEHAFKKCLATVLGDQTSKDWGGESSDHFTSNLHLDGRRVTAAFLLKGPAWFAPMGLNHLGKNNDQIVRLAQEPAEVPIVQHCHEIKPAVRSTLRAFSVKPFGSRRYCLIDGKDSLRFLIAYNLFENALTWSKE